MVRKPTHQETVEFFHRFFTLDQNTREIAEAMGFRYWIVEEVTRDARRAFGCVRRCYQRPCGIEEKELIHGGDRAFQEAMLSAGYAHSQAPEPPISVPVKISPNTTASPSCPQGW